jgi:short-subunit dehydrogenase
MVARGRGGVLNVASLAGLLPMPYLALYGATKSYLVALSRAVASELAGTGVTVSVLLPGPVDTSFFDDNIDQLGAGLLPALPAEAVALAAIDGHLAGQTVITPGILGGLARLGLKLLPYRLLAPFVTRALRPSLPARGRASAGRALSPDTQARNDAVAMAPAN